MVKEIEDLKRLSNNLDNLSNFASAPGILSCLI